MQRTELLSRRLFLAIIAVALLVGGMTLPVMSSATAATLTPQTLMCDYTSTPYADVSGQAGDTIALTVTSCAGASITISDSSIATWTDGTTIDPTTVAANPQILTFTLESDGYANVAFGGNGAQFAIFVSTFGEFSCSVAGTQNETWSGYVGQTVSVHLNGSCDVSASPTGLVSWVSTFSSTSPTRITNDVAIITVDSVGTTTWTAVWPAGGRGTLNIAITGIAAPLGPVDGPPNVLQQVGRASGEHDCTDVNDAHLNWAGVSSGGWTPSWAMWAVPVTGGWVCNRTLYYNAVTQRWDIAR